MAYGARWRVSGASTVGRIWRTFAVGSQPHVVEILRFEDLRRRSSGGPLAWIIEKVESGQLSASLPDLAHHVVEPSTTPFEKVLS